MLKVSDRVKVLSNGEWLIGTIIQYNIDNDKYIIKLDKNKQRIFITNSKRSEIKKINNQIPKYITVPKTIPNINHNNNNNENTCKTVSKRPRFVGGYISDKRKLIPCWFGDNCKFWLNGKPGCRYNHNYLHVQMMKDREEEKKKSKYYQFN